MNKIIIDAGLVSNTNQPAIYMPLEFRLNFALDIDDTNASQINSFEIIYKNGDRIQFDAFVDMINWNEDFTVITTSGLITEMRKKKTKKSSKSKSKNKTK